MDVVQTPNKKVQSLSTMKILIIVDEYGWAFSFFARGWKAYSRHQIEYLRVDEIGSSIFEKYDVFFTMNSRQYDNCLVKPPLDRTVCGLRSPFREWEEARPHDFVAVVTNSKELHEEVLAEHNLDKDKILYIRGAIDGKIFTYDSALGVKVGWSGNKTHAKRYHLLKRIWYPVEEKSDWSKEFFVRGRSRDDQVEFLRSLRCYVHPSMNEAMSQSIMEAVACGVPVVATNVGDTRYLVDEEWLVPPYPEAECVRQMNEKIMTLMTDLDLALFVGKRNRERFDNDGWCWSKRAKEYDDLFDRLFG